MNNDSGFGISDPIGMNFFRAAQLKGALSIEVATGLRHSRGSVLKAVNQFTGINHRTKKQALATITNVVEMCKDGSHVLWPLNDGTGEYGLYESEEFFNDPAVKAAMA